MGYYFDFLLNTYISTFSKQCDSLLVEGVVIVLHRFLSS